MQKLKREINVLLSKTKEVSKLKLVGHEANLDLNKKKLLVGSSDKCDIILKEDGISAYHAMLILGTENELKVIDLESINGTYINGERVENGVLYPGDCIQFSKINFNLDEVIEDIQRNEAIIEDEDMEVHTFQEQEKKNPTPVLPPVPGLVIIDGEYCDKWNLY